MRVSIYNRETRDGRRQYFLADKNSIGPFYLRYEKDGKRTWHPTRTSNYALALSAAYRKEASLLAEDAEAPKPLAKHDPTLEEQKTAFIHDKETTFKPDGSPLDKDTIDHYHRVVPEFIACVGRTYAREITKQDLKNWIAAQRQRVSHRTICNLYVSIACFLKFCGIDHKMLLPRGERPVPVEETPECYEQDEMTKFFFVITDERDALFFEFLLKTGVREREGTNLEWIDLNLGPNPTVKIQNKEGFRTKTGKSRTIPLEHSIAGKLTVWHENNPQSRYVFPRADGGVERKFLDRCKRYARLAGLNCGTCEPCIKHKECENYYLHKFRDTFATWSLRHGVDIRTVQHWMGHADISMTQRYLAPEQGERAQSAINRVYAVVASVGAN